MDVPIWSPVVELRQYQLHPGRRDELIELFDSTFVEPQEQAGMKVIGQFRDLDDDNRFTWMRGFPSMEARARSLAEFYDGPVWLRHRDVANATMIDSDNVLLLRPAGPDWGFRLPAERPNAGEASGPAGVIEAAILHIDWKAEQEVVAHIERGVADVLACFATERSRNTFPRLPVREGDNLVVVFTASRDGDHSCTQEALDRLLATPGLQREPELLRLSPTSRSLLTGTGRQAPNGH